MNNLQLIFEITSESRADKNYLVEQFENQLGLEEE